MNKWTNGMKNAISYNGTSSVPLRETRWIGRALAHRNLMACKKACSGWGSGRREGRRGGAKLVHAQTFGEPIMERKTLRESVCFQMFLECFSVEIWRVCEWPETRRSGKVAWRFRSFCRNFRTNECENEICSHSLAPNGLMSRFGSDQIREGKESEKMSKKRKVNKRNEHSSGLKLPDSRQVMRAHSYFAQCQAPITIHAEQMRE